MDKKKLSKIPRQQATAEMQDTARRLSGIQQFVTADLAEDGDMLIMYFYRTADLAEGKTSARFRVFFAKDDYISQDLTTEKVKWLTSCLLNMYSVNLFEPHWDEERHQYYYTGLAYIRSDAEKEEIEDFFKGYRNLEDKCDIWSAVFHFQDSVMRNRLKARREKETSAIDALMAPITDPPKEFFDWAWEEGMSFSRYLIYKDIGNGKADCECTYCKQTGSVDRKKIRLRNNEKGDCPFCGSPVTYKARGRMAAKLIDERWFVYVDPTDKGFVFRYFRAVRIVRSDKYIDDLMLLSKARLEEYITEYCRTFYTFHDGQFARTSYEWGDYKNSRVIRWCPDQGRIPCMYCILYPGNLPQAWAHTPMKYSALEILSSNCPTVPIRYEDAITEYLKFPKLEWICKMGLNNLAKALISHDYSYVGDDIIDRKGKTIFEILRLNKLNTRVLQAIDGDSYQLKILQSAQEAGVQFSPEELAEYSETFQHNTILVWPAERKATIHKILKYIEKESEHYPAKKNSDMWWITHHKKEDPRIERKRNTAKDWIDYIGWCKELKYDINNMFIYMPTNLREVHDRTEKEYKALQDKKAAAEKRRQERLAKKHMEQAREAMKDIFKQNEGVNAFQIKGKGLLLVVPHDAEEIKAEGVALHHCVATYVNKVARGETNIFFVRKAAEPDKPYFTMEFKDNHVEQCRGLRNCGMPPDVKAFVNVFEQKMQEQIKENEERRKAG